jgi:hypothetical protein
MEFTIQAENSKYSCTGGEVTSLDLENGEERYIFK